MVRKFLSIFYICVAAWFLYLALSVPALGIYVKHADDGGWQVRKIEKAGAASSIPLVVGDRITAVNGVQPDRYFSTKLWRTVDQAETIAVDRNGHTDIIPVPRHKVTTYFDVLCFIAGGLTILIAGVLDYKMQQLLSARYLSLVFGSLSLIFLSTTASIRGDAVGKIVILSLLSVLPVLLYHFLVIFFSEKGKSPLPVRFVRFLYMPSFLLAAVQLIYFSGASIGYRIYRIAFCYSILSLSCFLQM